MCLLCKAIMFHSSFVVVPPLERDKKEQIIANHAIWAKKLLYHSRLLWSMENLSNFSHSIDFILSRVAVELVVERIQGNLNGEIASGTLLTQPLECLPADITIDCRKTWHVGRRRRLLRPGGELCLTYFFGPLQSSAAYSSSCLTIARWYHQRSKIEKNDWFPSSRKALIFASVGQF